MKTQSAFSFVRNIFPRFLLLFFTVLCAFVCFSRLDEGLIQHWDEARHGVNAYEMMKSNNYIVNTYNYENDYFNLKPPLSYWGIILGFRLFGTGVFGMRFYSALAMLLTFLLVALYLLRRYGKTASLCSMMLFLTFYDLFYWHAARNADADSIYILFFTAGCLALIESARRPGLLWICGLMFSLCFLSKSWHACVLLPIGGLFWLFSKLYKRMKFRHYAALFLCAAGPIALWALVRYQYDGMEFLGQMFGVDVTQRIAWSESSNPDYFFFLNYLLHSRAVLVAAGTMAFALLFLLLSALLRRQPGDASRLETPTAKGRIFAGTDPDAPAALGLALWVLVPVLVFSLSHTYYYWYVYPVFPGLCLSASILVQRCRNVCRGKKQLALFACVFFLPALAALHYDRITVSGLGDLEPSGFQLDLQAAMENRPDLHGMEIYVEKSDNEYKESFYWEQAGLLMAELSGELKCEEGGVEAFLETPGSALLIVDPAFYEKYEAQLSGLETAYRNEYIVLVKTAGGSGVSLTSSGLLFLS